MPLSRIRLELGVDLAIGNAFIEAVRSVGRLEDLHLIMASVTHELGFRYYALIHHDDLRGRPPGMVNLKEYPGAITERLIEQGLFRKDPVVRGCRFADSAFMWSELPQLIELTAYDREQLERGAREGLNAGITVPCFLLGDLIGSCTFAGTRRPDDIARYLGSAHVIGTFAFQAARRLVGIAPMRAGEPRLEPRMRDCIILAGRGLSNKAIARKLGISPKTVDGYMTAARILYDAHSRGELGLCAVLSGDVGFDEIFRRKPG